MSFREQGIEPHTGFEADEFVVRPLVPADAVVDHEAVMSSRDFLYHWEQDPPYPPADFSVDDNRADLETMFAEHQGGTRYTYTVMTPDESLVLGCIYLLPNDDRMYRSAAVSSLDGTDFSTVDATMAFWVRTSRWADGLEHRLLTAVLAWLGEEWSLESPVVMTNEHLAHQISTIEAAGLTLRFTYDRDRDMYTSLAYA